MEVDYFIMPTRSIQPRDDEVGRFRVIINQKYHRLYIPESTDDWLDLIYLVAYQVRRRPEL